MTSFLTKFCNIKENYVYIDYTFFKYFANENNYNDITAHVLASLHEVLKTYEKFTIHLSLKHLTVKEIDLHYNYIAQVCTIFKTTFPEKLDICFVHNAPFVFSQLFSIISVFLDKITQKKIQLVKQDKLLSGSKSFETL